MSSEKSYEAWALEQAELGLSEAEYGEFATDIEMQNIFNQYH